MKTYEIPVLLKVTVTVEDDGSTRVISACADNEAAPWAYSADPCAYEPDTETWHDGFGSDAEAPWQAAYASIEGAGDLIETNAEIVQILNECHDYFSGRADADCVGDPLEFVGNEEMGLQTRVETALTKLGESA
jgi:hypothetical protein